LFLSAMAAYALSKIKLKITKALLLLVLFGTMIPFQVMLAPLFTLVNSLGLIDTYPGFILPYIAFGVPYQVFILHGCFRKLLGNALEEAVK
ncbi:carbohydrate ABC transporter permease, partial [Rhizobium leguminosarum]